MRPVLDWKALPGITVEIRQNGLKVCSGLVDAVTPNGDILWVRQHSGDRRLYEKASRYEAWTCEDRPGFLYRTSMSGAAISLAAYPPAP
jgi:hypothetical protein